MTTYMHIKGIFNVTIQLYFFKILIVRAIKGNASTVQWTMPNALYPRKIIDMSNTESKNPNKNEDSGCFECFSLIFLKKIFNNLNNKKKKINSLNHSLSDFRIVWQLSGTFKWKRTTKRRQVRCIERHGVDRWKNVRPSIGAFLWLSTTESIPVGFWLPHWPIWSSSCGKSISFSSTPSM